MIEAGYVSTETEPVRGRPCFIDAQWSPRLSETIIRSICTMFIIDSESGQRLHLRSHLSNVRLHIIFIALSGKAEASRLALNAYEGFRTQHVP